MGPGRIIGVVLSLTTVLCAVGCGGTSVKHQAGDEAGGSGGSAQGGAGGSSAGSNGCGATGCGATGATAAGGKNAIGGLGGSGAVGGCSNELPCLPHPCPDGTLIEPDCGCPVCSCDAVACVTSDCPGGQLTTRLPGACCDTCVDPPPPPGCENVVCREERDCGEGRVWDHPLAACCAGCMLSDPSLCTDLECGVMSCPAGYIQGDGTTGCCNECVPDPDYCERDADCVFAEHYFNCGSCTYAISRRHLEADPCFWKSDEQSLPPECLVPRICMPPQICPGTDVLRCSDNTCSAFTLL